LVPWNDVAAWPTPTLDVTARGLTPPRLTPDALLRAATRVREESWLLRPEEVAQFLNISRSKVYELIAAGKLPSVTNDRSRRIRREDLQRWLIDLAVEQR
jgi:excisionase family DNA binding protein